MQILKNFKIKKQQHPFHMVTPSPWPLLTSFSVLALTSSAVIYMHLEREADVLKMQISLLCLLFCLYRWFSDVITESTFEGNHTIKVTKGLRFGMVLFITSEIMFFFAFFWDFFHSSLIPSIHIYAIWPPQEIKILNQNLEIMLFSFFIKVKTKIINNYKILSDYRYLYNFQYETEVKKNEKIFEQTNIWWHIMHYKKLRYFLCFITIIYVYISQVVEIPTEIMGLFKIFRTFFFWWLASSVLYSSLNNIKTIFQFHKNLYKTANILWWPPHPDNFNNPEWYPLYAKGHTVFKGGMKLMPNIAKGCVGAICVGIWVIDPIMDQMGYKQPTSMFLKKIAPFFHARTPTSWRKEE